MLPPLPGAQAIADTVTNPRRLLALLHYYHLNNKGVCAVSTDLFSSVEVLQLSSVIKGFTMCVVKSEGSPGCRERLCRSGLVVGAQSGRNRVRSETHTVESDTRHIPHKTRG